MVNWDYIASLDFWIVWKYHNQLLVGFGVTLMLLAAASVMGLAFGSVLAMVSQSRIKFLRWLVVVYVEVWRNTPLLVQLFWIHFALPMITDINTTALESGLIALTANVTAYFSEIIRAGIQAVEKGQWEAAHALGLPRRRLWQHVILPQAFRAVVPPLVNLLISLMKATAILSVLSINDLMRVTASISNYTFKPIEFITAAAVVYFLFGSLMGHFGTRLERYLKWPGEGD